MICGMIALITFLQWFGRKAQAIEIPTLERRSDYTLPCSEIEYHRNEIDRIEYEIQEIEQDLRIKDSVSHLRSTAYKDYKKGLHDDLNRHNLRIEEIEFNELERWQNELERRHNSQTKAIV